MGRAQPARNPLLAARVPHGARDQARARRRRHRFHRHRQPARDDHRLGPVDGRTRVQRHRVAMPPHVPDGRGDLQRPPGRGDDPRKDGASPRRVLLGKQNRVDTSQRAGGSRASPRGRAALWHGGHVADLGPHGRARSCNRPHERQPHHALRHPQGALGRGTAGNVGHPSLDDARGQAQLRLLWRDELPRSARRHPDHGRGGRSTGGALWSVLL